MGTTGKVLGSVALVLALAACGPRSDDARLNAARECDINLSAMLEKALHEELRRVRRERWLAENASAISAYNEQVDEHGVFSDGLRSF